MELWNERFHPSFSACKIRSTFFAFWHARFTHSISAHTIWRICIPTFSLASTIGSFDSRMLSIILQVHIRKIHCIDFNSQDCFCFCILIQFARSLWQHPCIAITLLPSPTYLRWLEESLFFEAECSTSDLVLPVEMFKKGTSIITKGLLGVALFLFSLVLIVFAPSPRFFVLVSAVYPCFVLLSTRPAGVVCRCGISVLLAVVH